MFLLYHKSLLHKCVIAHTVPAVYDIFAARIRALRSKDQGCKNVAEKNPTKGAARLGFSDPEPPTGGEA
jgi:hypothetical protein